MAERRMFAKTIIDSDAFLDMPLTTQALYFHLSMRADDDGFVNNPKKILRMVGAGEDDAKLLITKQFIIPFESGIVVIRHWKIHNYIRKDTYSETKCKTEKRCLELDENQAYVIGSGEGLPSRNEPAAPLLRSRNEPADKPLTQDRLGKDRIGKDRIGKDRVDQDRGEAAVSPAHEEIRRPYGEYNNVLLTDTDLEKLKAEPPDAYSDYIERLSRYMASKGVSYQNHLATIRSWAQKDREQRQPMQETKDYSQYHLGKYV